MNRTVKTATLLIALAVAFSFSQEQENEIRFGGRVAYNISSKSDYNAIDGGIVGPGFAVGAAVSIPIIGTIAFNPELNLIYRQPLSIEVPENVSEFGKVGITEFAISIPALFQFMPLGGPIFYLEAGIQLDIPFATNEAKDILGIYPDRTAFDFGIPLGIGWHIGKHFALDYRIFVGLTSIGKRLTNYSLVQSELGLIYLI